MLKNLKNRLNENKGFSLVELIVVIAIMVILIALLVPNVVGYIAKAQKSANLSAAKSIYNAANTAVIDYKSQKGGYPKPEELAATLNSGDAAEKLAVVPKGTAAAIGYDGAGNVWAVAVGSTNADTLDKGDKTQHIQAYAPTLSGNVYKEADDDTEGLVNDVPSDLTISGAGGASWEGAGDGTKMADGVYGSLFEEAAPSEG